jgi:hypothetical protein
VDECDWPNSASPQLALSSPSCFVRCLVFVTYHEWALFHYYDQAIFL